MKIVFMGTPDFAQKSLEAIYNAGCEIVAVVTNPDKPKGRGMKMISSPVKQYADSKGLKIYQPLKIRNNEDFINDMRKLCPDLFCVVAYGKILPKELLEIPRYGAINVHGSLLPKYRGAAPIQWSVINGDKETGVTTMFMDEGMDTGDMILKEKVIIGDDETTGELWEELSKLGARLLVKTINMIENVSEKIEKKDEEKQRIKELVGAENQKGEFSTAPMINKEMAKIDWKKTSKEIHNLIRGLNPVMGAYSLYNDKKIKIWKTKIIDNIEIKDNYLSGEVFKVSKDELIVKTGDGLLSILEIQPENKKKMAIKDYLNGSQIKEGDIFK